MHPNAHLAPAAHTGNRSQRPGSWAVAVVAAIWIAGTIGKPDPAGAQTLERIQASHAIRIGYVAEQAPFASKGDDGVPAGYAIDLCHKVVEAIQKRVGGAVTVSYQETSLVDAFNAVASNQLDLLCGAITITLARRELVDFSEPIFMTGASALLRSRSPADLRELFLGERTISRPRSPTLHPFATSRIGVRTGSTTEAALQAAIAEGFYKVTITDFVTHADGLLALAKDQIDAYFADRALLLAMLEGRADSEDYVVGTRLLTREPYGIAMQRGDAELRLLVDRTLTALYATPEFTELLGRYFPGDTTELQAQILQQSIPE